MGNKFKQGDKVERILGSSGIGMYLGFIGTVAYVNNDSIGFIGLDDAPEWYSSNFKLVVPTSCPTCQLNADKKSLKKLLKKVAELKAKIKLSEGK